MDFREEPGFSFGDSVFLPTGFLEAVTEAASPFGVWVFLWNCFAAGIALGKVLGGSTALLDNMLENDIGSADLGGFDSSLLGYIVCRCVSSCGTSRKLAVSYEPCNRCEYAELLCDNTGDSSALRAGDCGIELCRLGGCA